jgi:hypothetical protein
MSVLEDNLDNAFAEYDLEALITPQKKVHAHAHSKRRRVVCDVVHGGQSKSLTLLDASSGTYEELTLNGTWASTKVEPGDTVVVIGHCDISTVDNLNGLLIVHPDTILSGTRITDAITCERRAVLSEMIRVPHPPPPLTLSFLPQAKPASSAPSRTTSSKPSSAPPPRPPPPTFPAKLCPPSPTRPSPTESKTCRDPPPALTDAQIRRCSLRK